LASTTADAVLWCHTELELELDVLLKLRELTLLELPAGEGERSGSSSSDLNLPSLLSRFSMIESALACLAFPGGGGDAVCISHVRTKKQHSFSSFFVVDVT
jgi:hypothetical protein